MNINIQRTTCTVSNVRLVFVVLTSMIKVFIFYCNPHLLSKLGIIDGLV